MVGVAGSVTVRITHWNCVGKIYLRPFSCVRCVWKHCKPPALMRRVLTESQVLDAESNDQRNEFVSGANAMFPRVAMSLSGLSFLNRRDDPPVRGS